MSEQMSPPFWGVRGPPQTPPMGGMSHLMHSGRPPPMRGAAKCNAKCKNRSIMQHSHNRGCMRKPLVLQTQKYFANGTVVASIYGMKNETFTLENRKMENVIITPSYTDYEKYFNDMSDDLLTVWIEVAERRLPNYRRWDDIVSVKTGLLAAKSVQEKREKIQQGG